MSDFDDTLAAAEQQPAFRVPVPVLLDAAAYNRSNELHRRIEQAATQPDDEDITADGILGLLEEQETLHRQHPPTTFVFEQIGAQAWSDLTAEYPKPDEFWVQAMAASCVEPDGATVEGFARWRNRLSAGQFEQLRAGCQAANEGLFDLRPTSAASALLRRLRQNSTTAPSGESPDPDSSDG